MITPFRRHTKECLATLAKRKPPLSDEEIRSWVHCKCTVFKEGSWNGKRQPRESTGLNDWKAAERHCKKQMDDSDAGLAKAPERISVRTGLDRWLTYCRLVPLAKGTQANYRVRADELAEFCARLRVTDLADITGDHINALRLEWVTGGIKPSTHNGRFGILDTFFTYAADTAMWITRNPIGGMKYPQIPEGSRSKTLPLDPNGGETEYKAVLNELILDAPLHVLNPMREDPARLVSITRLMYEAGLRISDALAFDMANCEADEACVAYTYLPIKTRRFEHYVTTYFSVDLWREIGKLKPLTPNRPFFRAGSDGRHAVSAALSEAGKRAGVPNVHPHRLRNSFAVNKLVKGASFDDVANWIGHANPRMTKRFYAAAVKARKDASRAAFLAATPTLQPQTKVVTMRRKSA